MSDKMKGLWVAFETDLPEEDARRVIDAIKQLRGVAGVDGLAADGGDWINRQRIRLELELKLLEVLRSDR